MKVKETLKDPLLVLGLDTATRAGSIALANSSRILASKAGDREVSHSISLISDIDAILMDSGVSLGDVDLFAVASGPGSFTGLRIGLATVKAFANTLQRPCIGIESLLAVAHSAGPSEHTIALLPAGRGEVYAQSLSVSYEGEVVPIANAEHIPPETLLNRLSETRNGNNRIRWAGEGARQYSSLIRDHAERVGIEFIDEAEEEHTTGAAAAKVSRWVLAKENELIAESVAQLAARENISDTNGHADQLQAVYVRLSDAELKERCR